jgi:hypothetical protein
MREEDQSLAGLLQALEHSLDLSDGLTIVLRQFIDANREGRSIDEAIVTEHERQLPAVAAQRVDVQPAITRWWALIGRSGPQ